MQYVSDENIPPAAELSELEKNRISTAIAVLCEGEPLVCYVAAASLILNRLESPDFPDTVRGVLLQKGEFPSSEASDKSLRTAEYALRLALEGEDPAGGSLYFAKDNDNPGFHVTLSAGRMSFGL